MTRPRSALVSLSDTHLAKLPLQPLMPFDGTGRLGAAIPFALDARNWGQTTIIA